MPFKRVWDSKCPQVYDRWEADGASWVIQDLPPEDDGEALDLLMKYMAPDEALCSAVGLLNDKESVQSIAKFWRLCLERRMSLACYVERDTKRTLAALNCCQVICADGDDEICEIEGECWKNVYNALHYCETRINIFDYLKLDKVLYAMGLVVRRDFRGAKLGARVLNAREPLSLSQGVYGTATVFTGPASQKCAEKAGFQTVATVTFKQLADIGLPYPTDDTKCIKLMVKPFSTELNKKT